MAMISSGRRRAPTTMILRLLVAAFTTTGFLATADLVNMTGQLSVFWGRHADEGSLREACDSGVYTTVIMSFLDVYGQGEYHLDLSGHPVAGMGDDIKHCQQDMNVSVSLAIGGFGGNYSLPTKQSALDLADHLWNAYLCGGGGSSSNDNNNKATTATAGAKISRPFGDACLDGIDLFLEHAGDAEHYDTLATELATMDRDNSISGKKKPLQLTATAHCSFPDGLVKTALETGVLERIHVRFYADDGDGQDCEGQQQWDRWTAAYPGSRIFVGLLPSEEQGDYWIFAKDLYYGVMPVVQQAPNYGGVMLWDRYYDKKSDYSSYVKYWA